LTFWYTDKRLMYIGRYILVTLLKENSLLKNKKNGSPSKESNPQG